MDLIKLILIFILIAFIIKLKKPLSVAIIGGCVSVVLLYGIKMDAISTIMLKGFFGQATINLVLAFYTITFLQRMLEKRGHLILAERSLTNLFNSRRVNAMIAPFVIGLLPSAGAILIAAPIVDNAGGDYLSVEEKTFVTSYFRHISELFLPTYASILLAINLSGVDMTQFVLGMIPMAVALFLLGYFKYVRKIPKSDVIVKNIDKKAEVLNLVKSLWTIALTITIILVFKLSVHISTIMVIMLCILVNKFTFTEIKPMFKSAIESKLLITTVLIMVFKEFLSSTGVIEELPMYFSVLPVPPSIVFGIIFFFGTLVAGSQAIIALALPLAFATISNGGLALLIFLMCITYIAMQLSPTHICLAIVAEEYNTSFTSLVSKTIPIVIMFTIISSIYSYLIYLLS